MKLIITMAACAVAVGGGLLACDEPSAPPPPPPPDEAPPTVTVLSPVDSSYDLNADGLLDLHLQWSDSSGVDAASATVRVLGGIEHPLEGTVDLLQRWTVEARDDGSLLMRETPQHLLYSGDRRIEVRVADAEGNVLTDTIEFVLPPLSLHKRAPLEGEWVADDAVYCEDDGRLYMSLSAGIARIDPAGLVEEQRAYYGGGTVLGDLVCLPDNRIGYGSNFGFTVLDRNTLDMVFEKLWPALGLARSKLNPDIVYGGAGNSPVSEVYAFHRVNGEIMDTIPVPPQPEYGRDWLVALEVLPEDEKLYVAKWDGVYAVDPRTHEFLGRVRITSPRYDYQGNSEDLRLSPDARWLYVPVTYGEPHGLAIVSPEQDSAVQVMEFFNSGSPIRVAVSPSGERVFVTTVDSNRDGTAANYLVRPGAYGEGKILARLPHGAPAAAERFDGAVVFHPNGRYLYLGYTLRQTLETHLESYLNREQREP